MVTEMMKIFTLTLVTSIVNGRTSGREKPCTHDSSSDPPQTMKTMKPFLSMSRASDFVRGRSGDPAMTTTSTRPPFRLDLLAFLDFRRLRALLYTLYDTSPRTTAPTPITTLFLTNHPRTLSKRDASTRKIGSGGGGTGRKASGSHGDDDSVERTAVAAVSIFPSMTSARSPEYRQIWLGNDDN